MRILLDKKKKIALYIQIKNQIKEYIYSKKVPKNYVLPSERELAQKLGVNRSTVIKAYQDLKAEGLINSSVGKGTYVIYEEVDNQDDAFNRSFFWDEIYSDNLRDNFDDILKKMMNIGSDKNIISFSGGIPSPLSLPNTEFEVIQRKLLKNQVEKMFSHSPVAGNNFLRKEIRKLLVTRDIKSVTKEIMITSGSQQALDLIFRTFFSPNDVILVEEPTFFGAIQLFKSLGARVIGVPMDDKGIRIDILEYLITKHNPKLIYTIPSFHNPTGTTMSLKRRYELITISHKYNVPIIEDDPYGELRYEGEDLPALKALDKNNYVIYISTFSKVISLGLRIGFISAPEKVINKLSLLKQLTDLHVNTFSQHLVCEFLRDGYYEGHLKKIKAEYLTKRNLMIAELKNNFEEKLILRRPEGGYYIWCKISDDIKPNLLLKKALEKGVDFIPGDFFYNKLGENNNYIRLNFTYPSKQQIVIGIKRLKEAVDDLREED